jgi:hypothetical protein
MKHSKLFQYLLAPFFMSFGDADGGGATDRGDDFEPTDEDEDEAAKAAADVAAEVAKIEDEDKGDEKVEEEEKEEKEEVKGKKDTRIPLARHQAILEKNRVERDALVAELARVKQGTAIAQTNESINATEDKLISMETEYNELLGKGELKEAAKLMGDIRRMERSIGDAKADMKAEAASAQAYERVKYDTTVSRVEEAYPELNVDSDDYDESKASEVMDLFSGFAKNGLERSAALQKAVKYVMGTPETGRQRTATEVDARVTAEQVAKERKAQGLKRNVDAANRQPADLSKTGLDSDKVGASLTAATIGKMSQAQFDKVSEADKAKARGDTV